jgi:hypothetical protein
MRNGKAFLVMAAYVTVLGAALYMIVASAVQTQSGIFSPQEASMLGQMTFMTVVMVQLGLVALVSPALTSGSITIEREQLTLDLLRLTRLTSREILVGKLVSSLSYLGILIAASLPVASLCFLLGGVSPEQVVAAYAVTLSTALLFGALGLGWSVISRKTAAAGTMSYATIFILMLGLPVYAGFIEMMDDVYWGRRGMAKHLAHIHSYVLVGILVVVVAVAGALLRQYLLSWTRLRVGRKGFWAIAALLLTGLGMAVGIFLYRHSTWVPNDMSVIFAPNPFTVLTLTLTDIGRYGPWPGPMMADSTWYWVGATLLYLAAAIDVMALAVFMFERSRARA